jgi:hypothetical protein
MKTSPYTIQTYQHIITLLTVLQHTPPFNKVERWLAYIVNILNHCTIPSDIWENLFLYSDIIPTGYWKPSQTIDFEQLLEYGNELTTLTTQNPEHNLYIKYFILWWLAINTGCTYTNYIPSNTCYQNLYSVLSTVENMLNDP